MLLLLLVVVVVVVVVSMKTYIVGTHYMYV